MSRRTLRLLFGVSIMLVIACLLFVQTAPTRGAATAATFTVNSTVDEPNSTLGSPVCSSTPSGVCTLRAAIMAANANPGHDIINIPGGTFHLTIGGNDNTAQAGDLDITEDLTVVGAGDGVTIIDGNLLSPSDRIFDIRPSAHVSMTGVTIRDGSTASSGGAIRIGDPSVVSGDASLDISNCSILNNTATPGSKGGGLLNATAGSILTITNCSIANNSASYGGGIQNNGSLTIVNSNIYSNTVDTAGGAIFNDAGAVTISGSGFSTNFSYNGGAIDNNGLMTITGGTFSNNNGGQGAGIENEATLVIHNTMMNGNASDSSGGGILNQPGANASLINVALTSNSARLYGGGIFNSGNLTLTNGMLSLNTNTYDGGGGISQDSGQASISNSAIVSNTAPTGGGILLFGTGGIITLTNSTVSGNTTSDVGAGIYNHGTTGIVSLANVTIAYNGTGYLKAGGGIDNDAGGTVNFKNTLLAWNFYQGIIYPVFINDCNGSLTSGGYNLVRVDCGFTHQVGDQVGTFSYPLDPKIGPLLYNGGSTPTHALLSGSPAINAGEVPYCTDPSGATITIDQRGYARPFPPGGQCDIGAYEYRVMSFLPLIRK